MELEQVPPCEVFQPVRLSHYISGCLWCEDASSYSHGVRPIRFPLHPGVGSRGDVQLIRVILLSFVSAGWTRENGFHKAPRNRSRGTTTKTSFALTLHFICPEVELPYLG